ncbi:MAG: AIPR family protein [Thermodesulfobacteriota bacterium]
MAKNDRIILDEILKQRQAEIDPTITASEFFELFTAEQVLKDSDLSYDEIDSGLVGDGGDGGIDAFYVLVNGELVQEDHDYSHLKKNIILDLVIVQAKTSAGFQETPVERFMTVSDDILDLSKPTSTLGATYNESLVEAIACFRTLHNQLATKFPTFRIRYYYASKGEKPDANVEKKVEKLKALVHHHFPSSEFSFTFLGASELLTLARRAPQTTYTLPLAENPISSAGQVGFVCLVRLRDYFTFISDSSGGLRRNIFEANVRDYQGRTAVNDDIQYSLQETHQEDFWWLNNGITVLASKASQSGKTLTIEDPQVVNGLQSSTEVFNYFKKFNTENDNRTILVRVIVPSEAESRDRIIKATNSQTAVQQASLRATDKVHRDIEEFFRPRGLFYDRRKNYYKNEGKPRDKIVGIPHLAQSVMAILLQRPDTARARPSSLLKKDADYSKVYSDSHPIEMYYTCAEIMRRVEDHLRLPTNNLTPKDRNNLRFYVAMHVSAKLTGKLTPSSGDLAKVDLSKLDTALLQESTTLVQGEYKALGGTDQVSKGTDLIGTVKNKMTP